MEIHLFLYIILASLMYFQHALMETTNVSTSDFNFEESRNPNARIKKRELKDYEVYFRIVCIKKTSVYLGVFIKNEEMITNNFLKILINRVFS